MASLVFKLPRLMTSVTVGAMLLASTALAEVESTDPIKLTTHDWSGQVITTTIMAEVLKKAGYNVELVQADYLAPVRGSQDRRSACRHGNLGSHRARGDG